MTDAKRHLDLAKEADAILKQARCDVVTGERKGRYYRYSKRAERKRLGSHWRQRRKKLGKFGSASAVRIINVDTEESQTD